MSRGLMAATLTLLAGGALAQLLPLLLGPWLTRLYSPTEFGHFSLLWTLASNVAVVACARYEFALPLATDERDASALVALCARVLFAVLLLCGLGGAVLAAAGRLELAAWLAPAVAAGALPQALSQWASRAQQFRRLAWARVLQYGGASVLQLALGLLGLGALGLLLGPMLAGLLAAACLLLPAPQGGWLAALQVGRPRWWAMARQHRDFPLFNTPHAFASAMQDSLALLLLSAQAGDAAAGYWALALRYLKAPAGLVGGALSQTLYPSLVNAGSAAEAQQLVRRAMLALMAIALPLALTLLLAGPWLFVQLFGERWHDAGALAAALAPYIAAHFIASPMSVVPMAWGAQAWALRLALVGQAAFVLGLAAGLHWGGLLGAAWGVSATMLLYFGYFFWALIRWKHASDESLA